MKALMMAIFLLFACLAQVTVAPLFRVSGAEADLPLVVLALFAVFSGPPAVMLGTPFAAICLGFASSRSPGLLLIGYLPLLPLGMALEEWRVPLNRYGRMLAAGGLTGIWLRLVLVLGAVTSGATVAVAPVIGQVLIPGLIFDLALLTLAYVPLRFVGWNGRPLVLGRKGFGGGYSL